MADWKIERRHGVCAVSGAEFADGEPIFSLLVVEEGMLGRRDVARAAWKDVDVADDAIFWRTRYREKKAGRLLDLDSIEALFLALDPGGKGQRPAAMEELRYLLALILVRKKRLKITGTRRPGGDSGEGEAFVLRRPRHTGEIVVPIHELDEERSAALREVLQRIFDGADLEEVARSVTAREPGEAEDGGGEAPAGGVEARAD